LPLFEEKIAGESPLTSLAERIAELRVKLGAEAPPLSQFAKAYATAYLRWRHGSNTNDQPASARETAVALLGMMDESAK
jgi:hypothetical protein